MVGIFTVFTTFFVFSINPSRPDPGQNKKINLTFYLQTFLKCLKRFYEGLQNTTKKCENQNLSSFLF